MTCLCMLKTQLYVICVCVGVLVRQPAVFIILRSSGRKDQQHVIISSEANLQQYLVAGAGVVANASLPVAFVVQEAVAGAPALEPELSRHVRGTTRGTVFETHLDGRVCVCVCEEEGR